MLAVRLQRKVHAGAFVKAAHKGVNRAIPLAFKSDVAAIHRDHRLDRRGGRRLFCRIHRNMALFHVIRVGLFQIFLLENFPNALRRQFFAGFIRDVLDDAPKFRVHGFRHFEAEFALHDVRDAPFAGLTVDANNGLIRPPHILRVNRQIRHRPHAAAARFLRAHALVDRVLMRAGKRRIDEFADIRMARVNLHARAFFVHVADVVDVREIQLRVNALRKQVQRHRHDVHVARALAVAEQRAFDAIRARHDRQFRRRDRRAAIIVRVQADQHAVALPDIAAEPFDLIGIDVRRRHFHR